MRSKWFAPLCVAAMALTGALLYSRLPAHMPVHWGINGQPDRFGSRLEGTVLLPGICLAVWLLLFVLPRIDPRRAAYEQFRPTLYLFINAVVLLLVVVYVAMLGVALGWHVDMPQIIGTAMGVLFLVLGNEMGRIKPNWFVGIRTPWTLADPEVWRRTHRVGGRMFFVAGLAMLVAVLLPPAYTFVVVVCGALGAALLAVAYSYVAWRQRAA